MDINTYINEAHATADDKGWWDAPERTFGDQIALMHSELSEALEEYRKWGMDPEWFLYSEGSNIKTGGSEKPEGIAAEFADVLIRIFDTCGRYDIPLQQALDAKLAYNKTRPHKHGGKVI